MLQSYDSTENQCHSFQTEALKQRLKSVTPRANTRYLETHFLRMILYLTVVLNKNTSFKIKKAPSAILWMILNGGEQSTYWKAGLPFRGPAYPCMLKKWPYRNLMKFNNSKCKILHLETTEQAEDVWLGAALQKRTPPRCLGGQKVEHESIAWLRSKEG